MQNHPIKIDLLTYISLIHSIDVLKDGCISNSHSNGNSTQMTTRSGASTFHAIIILERCSIRYYRQLIILNDNQSQSRNKIFEHILFVD